MSVGKYDYKFEISEADVQRADASHTKILKMVSPHSVVLECGPADGIMTRYLKEILNCTVFIIELDSGCYEHAIQYADGGVCADLEDDAWLSQFNNSSFDYILYADVLEHLRNPQRVLMKMKRYLKPDGEILLSVPNVANGDIIMNLLCDQFIYTPLGLLDNTHIHLFSRKTLHTMIRDAGYYLALETCTCVPLFATEQGAFLPVEKYPQLEKALLEHPTRNVYQFICKLKLVETKFQSDIDALSLTKKKIISRFYFDLGDGFSEKNRRDVEALSVTRNRVYYHIPLPEGCIAVRYDPVENQACMAQNIEVTVDQYRFDALPLNGVRIGSLDFFFNQDPQFLIAPLKNGKAMRVEVSLELLGMGSWSEVSKVAACLLRETKEIMNRKEDQLRSVRKALEIKEGQLQSVNHAKEQVESMLQITQEALEIKERQLQSVNAAKEQAESVLQITQEALKKEESQLQSEIKSTNELKQELKGIQESFSWKLTQPLRRARNYFRGD